MLLSENTNNQLKKEWKLKMDKHTVSVISEVMYELAKILEYYEHEQDMTKEEWNDFINYELPNMISKLQYSLWDIYLISQGENFK